MNKFLYLFHSNPQVLKAASPEEMERLMKAWMKWTEELRQAGHLEQLGERLKPAGKLVRGKEKAVTDGPFAEAKDTIGGYLLVQASDLDQAVELSKGCPIFELDGGVEVRPILPR
jgi:hypothetical protein